MKISQSLSQELEKILKNARNERSGEPLSEQSKESYHHAFNDFFQVIARCHTGRSLDHLADFTSEDIKEYKSDLESRIPRLKPGTITNRLMAIKGIFKAAFAQNLIPEDIRKGFKVFWPKHEEQYRRLQRDEVERLCRIDDERLAAMELKAQYVYLRNKAMVSLQKDAALRLSEVVNLSMDDILIGQKSLGGHVPLLVWESKDRPAGFKDTVYITPWGFSYLKAYLSVRAKYLETQGLTPGTIVKPKTKEKNGPALFFSEKNGHAIKPHYYAGTIFASLIREAKLPQEYTTHYLRHTQISEWVEAGLDPKRVQRLARHTSLEMTLRYYHFSDKELIEDLDRRFGDQAQGPMRQESLPEKPVRLPIMRHAVKSMTGQDIEPKSLEALDAALQNDWKKGGASDIFYTVSEALEKLQIQRTQLYEGWIRSGRLHPLKLGKGTVFLKTEVDDLSSYRTSEEASKILGYKEKVPVTVAKLAESGVIPAVKMGRGWRFKDRDLVNYLLDKRSGRLRLKSRLQKMPEIKATPQIFPLPLPPSQPGHWIQ